jgi:hypothetical protein
MGLASLAEVFADLLVLLCIAFPPLVFEFYCPIKKGIPHQVGTPFAISSSVLFSKQVFWLSVQPD